MGTRIAYQVDKNGKVIRVVRIIRTVGGTEYEIPEGLLIPQ